MIDRLKLFMDSYNLSAADLADEIDVQRSGISHLLSGRNNPSLSFITKLLEHYPELSPDWLLFDKGAMIRGDYVNQEPEEKKTVVKDLFQEMEESVQKESESNMSQLTDNEEFYDRNQDPEPSVVRSEEQISYGNSKELDKIVMFYKDKTFIEYKSR
ncbi:MAG: XRE family transcriptional regulator [Marinilabiliales bacterium]|nr:MAG: XRE family transcriptional regulator [Marinilabiliales bacterium]